ncbi:MAG: trypsin-like peptidase domain-containing protein [Eubacteriales bacterium]|nr:trypsin-like peptidase domain-containing protein [Eubacteriales bacterium]
MFNRSLAVFASATIVVSGALGFGGGYVASQYFPASTAVQAVGQASDLSVTSATAATDQSGIYSENGNAVAAQSLVNNPAGTALSVAEIAQLASPAVVEIRTEVKVSGLRSSEYIAEGAGSGVIIGSDGLIMTNNHVIEGASKMTVRLKDGQTFEATLLGTDSVTDVALIKIAATGLPTAQLGDSDQLQVGDLAVAIGNPLGELGGTVTDGIISALDREISLDNVTMNLLQTNAAINPGNSGGGLFDESGKLIGLVVAKSSGTGVEGLGFAIPVNDVKTIINDLERYGAVQGRVKLGVTLLDINSEELVQMYRVTEMGVYILKVDEAGNAARGGLQSGDRIVTIDDQTIASSEDVRNLLKDQTVTSTLRFSITRDGQLLTLEIALQETQPQV